MKESIVIFWFRRDLRLVDNKGLFAALKSGFPVMPIFIFDTELLAQLNKEDARVSFIHTTLAKLDQTLKNLGKAGLSIFHGTPGATFHELVERYNVRAVYTNHDYEPYARKRDSSVHMYLTSKQVEFHSFKDQVIFEKEEICKEDGNPYVVYTPYKNKWKASFDRNHDLKPYESEQYLDRCTNFNSSPFPHLKEIGFIRSKIQVPDFMVTPELIADYGNTRDFPAKANGTSRLGPHLRFGTVSIRQMVTKAIAQKDEVFWNELIWREFFMQILWHFPKTVNNAFRPDYDRIQWRNDPSEFEKWKKGMTGYPLVDAGMRQLNTTGYMHNRVRMLVASFLCKHLLIDWRWGEGYFAEKLLDYDLSANVGNWQWAAGSGVDAAPYFRIFNPTTQIMKFDRDREYIQKWVPDLQELSYPLPMVDHKMARERCLRIYKAALGK